MVPTVFRSKTMAISSKKTRNTPQPKVDESCLRLTQLAHRLGADAQLPRVTDLKAELGVSLTTLDSALRRLEEQDVIYRKRGAGIFVSPAVQATVGLICDPDMFRTAEHSPFWNMLVDFARERARSHGEGFEMHFGQRQGAQPLQRGLGRDLQEKRISGVIGVGLYDDATDWIEAQGVPLVNLFGPGAHQILLNQAQLVREGVRELIALGCHKPALWYVVPPFRPIERKPRHSGRDQIPAFGEALAAQGLPFDPAQIEACEELLEASDYRHTTSPSEQGRILVRRVFGGPRETWPDGLLITDDQMTRGALAEMERYEVRPGRDVFIVSHANSGSPVLEGYEDRLTRIEIDPHDVVNTVFATLETLMKRQEAPARQLIAPHRVQRPTTGAHADPLPRRAATLPARIAQPV